jgi:hypothetical protein
MDGDYDEVENCAAGSLYAIVEESVCPWYDRDRGW